MAAQWCTDRILAFEWGYLSFCHFFSTISESIAISHAGLSLKPRFFGLHFVANSMGLTWTTVTLIVGPKDTEFSELTRNNGHVSFKVNLSSPISVSVEVTYATSCEWIIVTFTPSPSRTVSDGGLLLSVKFSLITGGWLSSARILNSVLENLVSRN